MLDLLLVYRICCKFNRQQWQSILQLDLAPSFEDSHGFFELTFDVKSGTLEKLAQCSSILNQGVPITPNDSLVLVRHNHEVRQSNNMINTLLLLRIWPELLCDAFISLSCQIEVFLLEWIGSFKHALERVVILDLPHDQRIHELDDAIWVLFSPFLQLLSSFWCPCFLCLLNLLNALMNIE